MREIRESEGTMNIKDFIGEAKKRGLKIGALTADQKKKLEEMSSFDEAFNQLGLSAQDGSNSSGSGRRENPKDIYLSNGPIDIAYNDKRDMGLAMAGDIIKAGVYGLIPKMFELNLTGPTFYKNEQFQSQVARIYELICKYLRRNVNYSMNDLTRFIVNNISLGAMYYIMRRKYGFSQFITDDCPEFYNLWNIEYNHNVGAGLYMNCNLNQEMLNPSDNDVPSNSEWNRIDTTAVVKEIEDRKFWLFIPKNINTLFEFWFDNVYILDDDYHNRKFSFASIIDLDWLEYNPELEANVNKRINVSKLNANALKDLLTAMIGDVKFSNIRADIANAEEKGMKLQFERTIFSITDYVTKDHLVKSKTYVQALVNAYTIGTNLDEYINDNFMRIDWIDEQHGDDPYTALLLLGQFAKGVRNTNVVGFQAVNYVMRIYASKDHIIKFSIDRSTTANDIEISTPSVLAMTTEYISTATIAGSGFSYGVVNNGSAGDAFASISSEISYTGKAYAHPATYEAVLDPYDTVLGAIPYNCYQITSESCPYYNKSANGEIVYSTGASEIKSVITIQRDVVMGEFYAGSGFYLSDNQRDTIAVKALISAGKTKIWMQMPVCVVPVYANPVATFDEETIAPSHVHIVCYAWEWDLYTREVTHQHFNVYKFQVSTDNTSSVRWVKPIKGDHRSVVGFGLIGQMMNSMVAYPTDAKISDLTGEWRVNSTYAYTKLRNITYATDSDFLTAIAAEPGYVGRAFQSDNVVNFTYDNVQYVFENAWASCISRVSLDYATMGGAIRNSVVFKDLGNVDATIISKYNPAAKWHNALDSFILGAPSFTRDFSIDVDATGFVSSQIQVEYDSGYTSAGDNSVYLDTQVPVLSIDNTDTGLASWFFIAAGYCIPIYSTEVIKASMNWTGMLADATSETSDGSNEVTDGYAYTVLYKEDFVPFVLNRSELGEIYKSMVNSLVKLINFEDTLK